MTIVGQPAVGTVSFYDDAQQLYDPARVVLSSVAPYGTTTPYVYGTDPAVTKVSKGVYQLRWVPNRPGDWMVIGDAFDLTGVQLGAGASQELAVLPRVPGTVAFRKAVALVESAIGRPLREVTETVLLRADRDGILELPRGPVTAVTSVVALPGPYADVDDPGQPVIPTPTALDDRLADPGIYAYGWHRVTYTHGWREDQLPEIITATVDAVAARLAANPDGVADESIGQGYRVNYGNAGQLALTPDEKEALRDFRKGRVGTLETVTFRGGPR